MNKDIELTNGDVVTNYELCLTFFTVIQQTNNYVFSDLNLYKVFLQSEAQIVYNKIKALDKYTEEKMPKMSAMLKESISGPWKNKCISDQVDYGKKEPVKENFSVDVSIIR